MKKIDKNKAIKLIFSIIAFTILFFTCKLMLKGGGISSSGKQAFLVLILIVFLSASKKSFWLLVFPMCVAYAIYSPIGSVFGKINYQYLASVFATDFLESREFLSQIPKKNFTYPILIIGGILIYWKLINKYKLEFYKNKTLIIILIIAAMANQSPLDFLKTTIKSCQEVRNELIKLNSIKKESEWQESTLSNSKYNTYILVIGESARKDYHHAYGYPIENTPFMSTANGMLIDGLTAGGSNTVASLRLMLTKANKNDWSPNYSMNLIDLVNSAGLKTYWLSNQGYFGTYDTPVTAISANSENKFFIKSGEYNSKNTSDFLLLEKAKEIIKNDKDKKFIVIHLYGSHPDACDRITDFKKITEVKDKKYNYLNCYISSIQKTDEILMQLHNSLDENYKINKNTNSYSMIYFSDHGLSHNEINDEIIFNNNRESKLHFSIPLFKTSSDDKERNECSSFKSALNFTNGIASWIGIENKEIDPNYSLFDCKDDNDYGLKQRIENIQYAIDPAIELRDK